jgi:hypothetical protein
MHDRPQTRLILIRQFRRVTTAFQWFNGSWRGLWLTVTVWLQCQTNRRIGPQDCVPGCWSGRRIGRPREQRHFVATKKNPKRVEAWGCQVLPRLGFWSGQRVSGGSGRRPVDLLRLSYFTCLTDNALHALSFVHLVRGQAIADHRSPALHSATKLNSASKDADRRPWIICVRQWARLAGYSSGDSPKPTR